MNIQNLIQLCNPLDFSRVDIPDDVGPIYQDSRQVTEGSVFIAIRGTEVDGHLFIDDAIRKGAKVVICEEPFYTEKPDVCIIEVENSRSLLGPLAQAFAGNPARKMKVIGITGTNGKTTTATLVYQVLSACGKKVSLLGTVSKYILDEVSDSRLTTSDPIEMANDMKAMVETGSEFLVMEVSSHALDQARVGGFDFEVGAFTNLTHDHLDYHHTVEAYAEAKKILFDNLSASATAIVNIDDPHGGFMLEDCDAKILTFSFEKGENHILSNTTEGITIVLNGTHIKSPLIGKFNAYNVAEAFLICQALGLKTSCITEALKTAKGAPGRMEPVSINPEVPHPLALVDYAHTPDALENALSTLFHLKKKHQKLVVVFGAGGDRDAAKRPKMAVAAEKYADLIIVTSDNPRSENPDVIIADILQGFDSLENVISLTSREKAITRAVEEAGIRDIILVAGKGHENYQEINRVRHHFDDREVLALALRNKYLEA